LPEHFVKRPEAKATLLNLILRPQETHGALVISAVQGLGGIGKTTLIADLARDPQVYARYPDGVLWATLGQTPELLNLLHAWIRALGDYRYSPLTSDDATDHLRSLLTGKACLLVVDDAWNADHVRPFLAGSDRCQVLITTRNAALANKVHARLYELDVMSEAQALQLIESNLGDLTEDLPEAKTLAKELGYLPLALELAAAQIASGQNWLRLLTTFRKGLTNLDILSLDQASQRNESLRLSFSLSLQHLTPAEQESFAWLGVLPEETQLNPRMAAILWQLPAEDAVRRLQRFCEGALLKTVGEGRYTVHDLLHDEAKLRLAEQMPISQAHAALLERYYALCLPRPNIPGLAHETPREGKLWHTIPDDDYIHTNLTWHMEQAGQIDSIFSLLQEETGDGKNGWYQTCIQHGRLAIFLADLQRARALVQRADVSRPILGSALALEVLFVLCHTSIVSQSLNSTPGLLALGVKNKSLHPHHALTLVEQIIDNEQKIQAFAELAVVYPSSQLADLVAAAQTIGDDEHQARTLTSIIPHLPSELQAIVWPRALVLAQSIHSGYRTKILADLIPYLPAEVQSAVWSDVLVAFQSGGCLGESLSSLASRLPSDVIPQALAVVKKIVDGKHQAEALTALAPHLSAALFSQALAMAQAISNSQSRVQALNGLIPYIPLELQADVLAQALATIQTMSISSWRVDALTDLMEHLSSDMRSTALPQALAIADTIGNEEYRKLALTELSRYALPDSSAADLSKPRTSTQAGVRNAPLQCQTREWQNVDSRHALAAMQASGDEKYRIRSLVALAPYLPGVMLPQVLTEVQTICDDQQRLLRLVELAGYLSPELQVTAWAQALAIVQAIPDEIQQALELSVLAPRLPPVLLPQVIAAAQAISVDILRLKVLINLAPQLPPELLSQVFTAVQSVDDDMRRVSMLIDLAPHLPPELQAIAWHWALTAALAITQQAIENSDFGKSDAFLSSHPTNTNPSSPAFTTLCNPSAAGGRDVSLAKGARLIYSET
jgi:hypothetical protein